MVVALRQFDTLPQDACTKFAVGNSGQGKDGGLVGLLM